MCTNRAASRPRCRLAMSTPPPIYADVRVYEDEGGHDADGGELITVIEFLSATNKLPGRGATTIAENGTS